MKIEKTRIHISERSFRALAIMLSLTPYNIDGESYDLFCTR